MDMLLKYFPFLQQVSQVLIKFHVRYRDISHYYSRINRLHQTAAGSNIIAINLRTDNRRTIIS